MTDRQLLQQALDALQGLADYRYTKPVETTMKALNKRLERCDRCGKRLGGEGDIHTCTPKADPIGDAQDRLIAEMAAQPEQKWQYGTPLLNLFTKQPEQEPVACLNKTQAKAILDLALDLEKTGRMVVLTEGQERSDFAARNRNIQCALEDALRNATTPPAAQRQPLTDEEMWKLWNAEGNDAMNQQEAITFARAIEAAHGIKENT
jgi:hypothetical protein